MKSYYSIVSIATKPQFEEKFGVGLLCVTPEQTYFHFSRTKLDVLGKLLSKSAKKLVLETLQSIQEKITKEDKSGEIPLAMEDRGFYNNSYLNYLNRYNNSLIQFSSPKSLDLIIDQSVFETLFTKIIYSEEAFNKVLIPTTKTSIDKFRHNFKKEVTQYANTDYEVSNDLISGLVLPITIDLFGKNSAFVTGQTIDFSKGKTALHNSINEYMYLALSTEMKDQKAKCFLLGEEPDKKLTHNHQIWDNARKTEQVDFVPLKESDRIIDYLKEHGVSPVAE